MDDKDIVVDVAGENKISDRVEFAKDKVISKEEILGTIGGESELNIVDDDIKTDVQIDIGAKLSSGEKGQIELMIKESYVPVKGEKISPEDFSMEIKLTDDRPIYTKPRRLSFKQKQEVQMIIRELLEQGIIRKSQSPYAALIVLAKKVNGKTRMCVDYRLLNSKTVKDNYPLPLIEDCLSYLSGKKYFSTLDLENGFHQVPMHENSIPLTAFVTPTEQYEYCYMPFGLKNAPPVFQRYMCLILQKFIESGRVIVYLDDIIIANKSLDEHLSVLKEVLQVLSDAGLILNFRKC